MVVSASYADTAEFIYRNMVSSSDFSLIPNVGTAYKDEDGNTLIVRRILNQQNDEKDTNIVVFDKHYTSGSGIKSGSILSKKGNIYRANLIGSLSYSFIDFSFTTVIYPFEPLIMAGMTYSNGSSNPLVLLGARITAPLSNFFSSVSFTLVEDARLEGYVAAGVRISNTVDFACSYGFAYKHNLGIFTWGIYGIWLSGSWGVGSISPGISIGVNI